MRYRNSKAKPLVDWSTVDFVVGTRADVTMTGIQRPCARCEQAVFTSRCYPDDVAMICEVCALAIAIEEAAEQPASTDPAIGPAPQTLLDPWRRVAAPSPRASKRPTRRRLAPKPRPTDG